MKKEMKYTDDDLKLIAEGFNNLVIATKEEILSKISIETTKNYFSQKNYIDYNMMTKKFIVCRKYKGWKEDID